MEVSKFKGEREQEIIEVFFRAFCDSEGETEGKAIKELVTQLFKFTKSNQAQCYFSRNSKGEVSGAVFFTPLRYENNEEVWMLSPMAVQTVEQGHGVGQRLIKYALDELANQGIKSVCTYGDPAFYGKLGFEGVTTDRLPAPFPLSQPEGWLWKRFMNHQDIQGKPHCVGPFESPDLW